MNPNSQIQELTTLKTIAEILNQSHETPSMLQTVLEKLLELTGLSSGWIFLMADHKEYSFVADHGLPPALLHEEKSPMHCGSCWCMDRYWDGSLKNAVNILNCKRLEDSITLNRGDTCGITHHATVPLRSGDQRFGILNVTSPGKTHFSDKELALLQSVAFQIGGALGRIHLYEAEQRRTEWLARLDERNRLARDLHDSVSQMLFSLSMTSKGVDGLLVQQDIESARASIKDMKTLSQNALKTMRELIMQLRPSGLEDGLLTALATYGEQLGLQVQTDLSGFGRLPQTIEETLWRIGQEALNNISKHASTDQANIKLLIEATQVIMEIADSGCGFTYPLPTYQKDSIGLSSMQDRAKAWAGRLTIHSELNEGTILNITIPLKSKPSREEEMNGD